MIRDSAETRKAKKLARTRGLEYVDLDKVDTTLEVATRFVSLDIMRNFQVVPLLRTSDGKLKILVHDPNNLERLDNLRFRLGVDLEIVVGELSKIRSFIEYGRSNETLVTTGMLRRVNALHSLLNQVMDNPRARNFPFLCLWFSDGTEEKVSVKGFSSREIAEKYMAEENIGPSYYYIFPIEKRDIVWML